MKEIHLTTRIKAPIGHCFLLSLSIDLHRSAASYTNEVAIAGVTKGIIGPQQSVTWKAKHFGMNWQLTSKITEYAYPQMFTDEMQEGPFKSIRHTHSFTHENDVTTMKDVFRFEAPLGLLGKIAENIFLESYLRKFLERRNAEIKRVAESEEWRKYLL
jgi:ligand-binding SRPBCC domain-containing protein